MNKATGEAQAGQEREPRKVEQDKHNVHPKLIPHTGLKKWKMREKMRIENSQRVRKTMTVRAKSWNTDDVTNHDLEP